MSDKTLTQISHYQKKLEKYAATGETEKLLCCIHKLKYLPVTVNHLEVTGVGKSINGLRHKNGLIGEKARALVQKWKLMVAEEEEEQLQQQPEDDLLVKEENIQTNRSDSQSNTPHTEHEDEYDPSDEGDRLQIKEDDVDNTVSYNPDGRSLEEDEENYNGCYNPKTSREDYLSIGSKEQYEYKPTIKSEPEEPYVYEPTKHESKKSCEYLPTTEHEPEESYDYIPTKKEREEHPSNSSSDRSSIPNGDATHSDKVKKDKSSHRSREESKHKKKKHKSKHDQDEKHKSSDHDSSFDHKKSKHKSSKSKDKKRDKEKESSKQSSSHSSSSKSSSSHKNKDIIENPSPLNSSNHGSSYNSNNDRSNPPSSSEMKRHREIDEECDGPSSKKSRSEEKQKDRKLHKSSKSSKEEHKSSKKKKEDASIEAPSEFEAALMGMESTSSKKKKKKKSKEKDRKEREVSGVVTPPHTPSDGSPKLRELNLDYREQLPQLPTNFEMETSASQLSTHYKPLPHVPQRNVSKDPFTSSMTNEEALNYMFTSKSSKQRRIYAGKASVSSSSVPSLFNICIRFLQENIDALETTGNITYDILKPVLEKANPQQLITLEDYNPYLLEDTDALWAVHCRKSFKNKQREEMETWREMFLRCTDEHQERMRSITESLQKKYITKAPPKRTTQLAYINTAAKPPKSVARAQARYGTASTSAAPVRKSAEQQNAASSSGSSSSNGGNSSNSSNNTVPRPDKPFPNKPPALKKPKVAPLMGKARQLMKKVCRR